MNGTLSDSESAAGLTYTIANAARAAGVHPHTIRKRVKAGKLQATKVEGPNGPEYRIPVEAVHQLAAEASAARAAGMHPQRVGSAIPSGIPLAAASAAGSAPTLNGTVSDSGSDVPTGDAAGSAAPSIDSGSAALAVARAQEMAAYTQRLLEPLHAQLREQAEEIGRLRAELRHKEEQLVEAKEAAERAITVEVPPARAWWRFW